MRRALAAAPLHGAAPSWRLPGPCSLRVVRTYPPLAPNESCVAAHYGVLIDRLQPRDTYARDHLGLRQRAFSLCILEQLAPRDVQQQLHGVAL